MGNLKMVLTIIEGVLFIVTAIIIKFRPSPKQYNPMLLSDILIGILCGVVLILGFVVTVWEMVS